jgi:hypothetical protein
MGFSKGRFSALNTLPFISVILKGGTFPDCEKAGEKKTRNRQAVMRNLLGSFIIFRVIKTYQMYEKYGKYN